MTTLNGCETPTVFLLYSPKVFLQVLSKNNTKSLFEFSLTSFKQPIMNDVENLSRGRYT